LACLVGGSISSLMFAVAASWMWMNTPAANQTYFPSAGQVTQLGSQQAPIVRGELMRVAGSLMGIVGGLGLMYFGIHQIINKIPFPFTTQNAAKAMAGLCTIIMCLGVLLISRSKKKPADSAADPQSNETRPSPDR